MSKRISFCAVIFCLAIGVSACAPAATDTEGGETADAAGDYPYYSGAGQLTGKADLIFTGTVSDVGYEDLDVSSGLDASMPYTIYDIQIEEVYKGAAEGKSIKIKQLGGGADGAGPRSEVRTVISEEIADIERGHAYLFLVETYENVYPSLLNPTQGCFDLENSETEKQDGISRKDIMEALNI
ncbi:MAG: hypothetical protein LBS85_05160 [Clostridiales Family XIII bacterium]|nr:hypothetical protein [Clostridiales Family XIII bacterium]